MSDVERKPSRQYVVQGPNGTETIIGTPVPLSVVPSEPWVEYLLADGTVVRLKIVVFEFARIDGRYEPDGMPFYVSKWQVLQHVSAPEHLRKQMQ